MKSAAKAQTGVLQTMVQKWAILPSQIRRLPELVTEMSLHDCVGELRTSARLGKLLYDTAGYPRPRTQFLMSPK